MTISMMDSERKEQHMDKKVSALLDPRGYQDRKNIKLAKRPSLEELKKGKILFYNNTKLGFLQLLHRI